MSKTSKGIQRTRLTHADYHRVCVHLSSMVDPGTQDISATLTDLEAVIAQNLGTQVSAQQLRGMCKELGLSYRSDGNGSATVARLQLAIDAMQQQLADIELVLEAHGKALGHPVIDDVPEIAPDLTEQASGGST
jgi:hypothetical protein